MHERVVFGTDRRAVRICNAEAYCGGRPSPPHLRVRFVTREGSNSFLDGTIGLTLEAPAVPYKMSTIPMLASY